MKARVTRSREAIARGVARWGSLFAAVLFLVAFVVDDRKHWPLYGEQVAQAGMIAAVFLAYVVAWRRRSEAVGAVLALVATAIAYVACDATGAAFEPAALALLAIGLPAVFFLVAAADRAIRHRRRPGGFGVT